MSKTRTHKRRHNKRKNGRSFFKRVTRTTSRAIPIVASGLKKVGANVKNITMRTKPKLEKGLGLIYKSVLSGVDLGLKGIKKGMHTIRAKTMSKTRRHR
jgi:hypothetical protein